MRHIPLSICHPTGHEKRFIDEAFESNYIAPLGPNVDAFEGEIRELMGFEGAVATSSCTAAIHLALIDLGIKAGDTVICSDLTFVASCNPATYLGANIVFVDSDLATFNIDPRALDKALSLHPEAKAVIAVDLYGQSIDVDPILALCKKYGVPLIEDAAEALGATYKGMPCGHFADYAAVSFNGNKIITSSGGGMVLSNDLKAIDHMRFLSTQARDPAPWYQHSEMGYNYRMSNISAGVGRGQLIDLGDRVTKKRAIYNRYKEALEGHGLTMMPVADYGESTCWLSVAILDKQGKDPIGLLKHLQERDIEGRPIWKPMHMQPLYGSNEFIFVSDSPVDEYIFRNGLCLPSDIAMTDEEQDYVIQSILEYLQ